MNIARNSFVLDQFHSDENLNDDMCDRYYEQWAKNSCKGFADEVNVLAIDEVVVGFITLDYYSEDSGESKAVVGLAAIKGDYQGRGLFNILIDETLRLVNSKGFTWLYYGTQLCNFPVLNTMALFGGHPIECKQVLHLTI